MGRCTSLIGLKGRGERRCVIQCGVCYGSVEMKEVGWNVGRIGKGGWGMLISAVDALMCNMDLIA